jgi:hypothetical protein
MTPDEKKLAAILLRKASDQFSNHGCNDFDLVEFIPDRAERDALVLKYFEWNGDPSEYYDASEDGDGSHDWRLMDWMLMDFLADRLEAS